MANLEPCPVCLNQPTYPTKLPCSHIFCFLCAKGAILPTHKCPLCRRHISPSFFNNPELIQTESTLEVASLSSIDYHWFYEGYNGWWLYDEQTSNDIETAYQNEELFVEVLIAGFIYVIDFEKRYNIELLASEPVANNCKLIINITTIVNK
ncbi:wwe domain containing protein [Dermatophagoides farinae]|uniref:E3 ubiquitin-protein ligase n=1 Tax=Dermatophagoides farinae TaxID=6954 RepID=A0A9D4P0H1_DERFA|nr:wwe domain containing protein [Dermatophagoides farinae]